MPSKTTEVFGTTLERVKFLGHRMSKTCERERTSMGEAKVACDCLIEDLTDKFLNLKPSELPPKASRKFIQSIPDKALDDFISAIPKAALIEMFQTIDQTRKNIAETKMATESFTQCLIDTQGKDLPMPSIKVDERDGQTVFNFIIEDND